jgi:hypothetical protein
VATTRLDTDTLDSRQPVLRVRVPRPMLDAVDRAARHAGMRRSSLIRELLAFALAERGHWPPTPASPTRDR